MNAARRELQAQVIEAHQTNAIEVAHRVVPQSHWPEGEHVARIALLIALEKHQAQAPSICPCGIDRRDCEYHAPTVDAPSFWGFAREIVLDELQTWLGRGFYWRRKPGAESIARLAQASS